MRESLITAMMSVWTMMRIFIFVNGMLEKAIQLNWNGSSNPFESAF